MNDNVKYGAPPGWYALDAGQGVDLTDTVEFPRITFGADSPASAGSETAWHRFTVTALVTVCLASIYAIQQVLWPRINSPAGLVQELWSWTGIVWAVAFIPAVLELAGLYLWRAPKSPPRTISNLVCWRIVSRGINTEALSATITATRREMEATPLFPYVIEVVVDSNSHLAGLPAEDDDLSYIVVPKQYSTANNTRAKARALNYALHHSPLGEHQWIVHMDEESWPTPSSITGIAAMIGEEEVSRPGRPRVGQGTIVYHRKWKEHPFFTLSDCVRTGSDKGRLYLSMLIGVPLFGLHGSFIVVRNDVEKYVGFDIGARGSLTEDAWWGCLAMDKGIRCRWVEGHIAEQCTQKATDFIKQRRRWFNGLARTSLTAPAALRWRITMIISMLAWASTPLSWAYTVGHLIDGGYINPVIRLLANVSLAVYIATTLVGLQYNLREHGIRTFTRKAKWAVAWLVCLPVFSLLESAAVAYAIVRPANDFHVVKK